MSLIWNTFGPWIVVAVLLLILALSLSGILRLARTHDWLSRENEVFMPDPQDRDRQQRELTEELRHDADLRAARKRRAEDVHRPQEAGATRPEDDDQLEADVRRLLGEDDEHTP